MSLSKSTILDINKLIKSFKDIKQQDKTLKKISIILHNDNPKDRTLASRYSVVKNMFRKITNDEIFLQQIKPEDQITTNIIKENSKIRDDRKTVSLTTKDILKITELRKSRDMYDIAIYLLFMSGRRTSELLSSIFKNKKKEKRISILGLKKRRKNIDKLCYFTPLVNKTKFNKIYNKFKRKYNNSKIVGNTNLFSRTLNRRIKSRINTNFHPHMLRGFYVAYLFKFRNYEKKKINTFIRDNLCHQTINASLNYTGYNIELKKDILK
jgi:site-specific recombinase XerC